MENAVSLSALVLLVLLCYFRVKRENAGKDISNGWCNGHNDTET